MATCRTMESRGLPDDDGQHLTTWPRAADHLNQA